MKTKIQAMVKVLDDIFRNHDVRKMLLLLQEVFI